MVAAVGRVEEDAVGVERDPVHHARLLDEDAVRLVVAVEVRARAAARARALGRVGRARRGAAHVAVAPHVLRDEQEDLVEVAERVGATRAAARSDADSPCVGVGRGRGGRRVVVASRGGGGGVVVAVERARSVARARGAARAPPLAAEHDVDGAVRVSVEARVDVGGARFEKHSAVCAHDGNDS